MLPALSVAFTPISLFPLTKLIPVTDQVVLPVTVVKAMGKYDNPPSLLHSTLFITPALSEAIPFMSKVLLAVV